RLGRDRSALCGAGADAALAGDHAQPRRRGDEAARPRGGARDDRAAGRAAVGLLPFSRPEGRAAAAARPGRRGAPRLRPGHRAGPYAGRGRPYPAASRPAVARGGLAHAASFGLSSSSVTWPRKPPEDVAGLPASMAWAKATAGSASSFRTRRQMFG